MALEKYQKKRKFGETPEPSGDAGQAGGDGAGQGSGDDAGRGGGDGAGATFVVQKHAARRLHYDFRLEIDGVLKSWAVPKGPSLNPDDKRLAVQTEDHPLEYGKFEGVIPAGNYGAGTVMIWDAGTWHPEAPIHEQLAKGDLKFSLKGTKLRGSFVLVRTKRTSGSGKAAGAAKSRADASGGSDKSAQTEWLLIKHRDEHVDPAWDIELYGESAATGRTLSEVRDELPPTRSKPGPQPGALEGAIEAPMPERPGAMLATLVEQPFSDPEWIFEVKWDGIHALAEVQDGKFRLFSRTGRNITAHYPELVVLPERLRARQALIDGEIVVLDDKGRSSFERLQSRMNVARMSQAVMESTPVVYYAFDILYCDGMDLREAPLIERKQLLREVLDTQAPFRFSGHVAEKGRELFELAAQQGAEGVIGKHAHSAYSSGRSSSWVKVKVVRELEAVIGGFTVPGGSREHFGALVLGLYDGKGLKFIGGVGSGFTESMQASILARLEPLRISRCPFTEKPDIRQEATWVEPKLVARVKYHEMTSEKRLRQPVFLGLRDDLDPADCQLERETEPLVVVRPSLATAKAITDLSQLEKELVRGHLETVVVDLEGKRFRLTHLDKVYFSQAKYTKREVLAYYFQAAEFILPFLRDRPLVLHRYPNGIEADSFYQKDAAAEKPEWINTVTISSEEHRDIDYYIADDLAALLFLTNLGCIEHHPWGSRTDDLEHPDYVFFDLDPVEGTSFETVVEVASEILQMLDRIEMKAFLKTSGATGFHLYLPLQRNYAYEHIRAFAEIVSRVVAEKLAGLVTFERKVDKRGAGQVYLDYSQNAMGRPLASVYSVRPFPHATVSAPILARELRKGLTPERFTIKTMPARLKKVGNLWAEFFESRQTLDGALEKLREEMRRVRTQGPERK